MVTRIQRNSTTMYLCEFCGFGYSTIEIAEHCEQHCDRDGFTSSKIRKKAVYEPRIHVIPVATRQQTHSLTSPSSGPKTLTLA